MSCDRRRNDEIDARPLSGRVGLVRPRENGNRPMLYAILCYNDEDIVGSWTKEQDDAVMARLAVVQRNLARQGRLGPVARLLPTTAATTVRKANESLVIDGPFAETKEQLLGFYVVECSPLHPPTATAPAPLP